MKPGVVKLVGGEQMKPIISVFPRASDWLIPAKKFGIMNPPTELPIPRRTWFTNLLGTAAICLGGIGSLFSAFAMLLAIGKPYANSATDPLGIFLIFILPPSTLLAGIGLLLRRRWARWWMVLLMSGLVVLGVKGLIAADPVNAASASMPGTAIGSIAVGGLMLLGLFSRPVRREFLTSKKSAVAFVPGVPPPLAAPSSHHEENQGWRVGHRGRDLMFYDELHGGAWQRIEIDGEMLTGRAHHVIYFANAETWRGYPEWARERREEIIARIKSRFREPDYEHQGGGAVPRSIAPPQPVRTALSKRDGSILPMLLFLLAIAAGSFWFAAKGVKEGATRLPVKHAANREVSRAEKPALFWTSISVLSALGTGCTVFAGWLVIGQLRGR